MVLPMITGNEGVSIALIISLVSLASVLINTFGGQKQRNKDEMESEIERRASLKEEFVKVNLKLDTFCRQLDEMLKKYDKTDEKLNDHEKRINALEDKVK